MHHLDAHSSGNVLPTQLRKKTRHIPEEQKSFGEASVPPCFRENWGAHQPKLFEEFKRVGRPVSVRTGGAPAQTSRRIQERIFHGRSVLCKPSRSMPAKAPVLHRKGTAEAEARSAIDSSISVHTAELRERRSRSRSGARTELGSRSGAQTEFERSSGARTDRRLTLHSRL